MNSSYRYYQGAPGVRFCFAVHPTFQCPLAMHSPDAIRADVRAAAELLGTDAGGLGVAIARGHRSVGTRQRDLAGKLTDRCDSCGAKMDRPGFATWVKTDLADGEDELGIGVRRNLFGGRPWRQTPTRYFDTKAEAREWALEEARTSKAAAGEAIA